MRLDNVFYGFTKNGERKLLWKKYKTECTSMGDVFRTAYYDLEEKKCFEVDNIDFATLVPIVKLVGDVHRMSKRRVKKVFKADNELLFDAKGAFYGDIVNKCTSGKLVGRCDAISGSGTYNPNKVVQTIREKGVLFARIADPECRVQAIKSSQLYPWSNRVLEGICVEEVRPINTELFDEVVVTKKKLLEADYKKEL